MTNPLNVFVFFLEQKLAIPALFEFSFSIFYVILLLMGDRTEIWYCFHVPHIILWNLPLTIEILIPGSEKLTWIKSYIFVMGTIGILDVLCLKWSFQLLPYYIYCHLFRDIMLHLCRIGFVFTDILICYSYMKYIFIY